MINPKKIEAAILNRNVSLQEINQYLNQISLVKGVCVPSSFATIPKIRDVVEHAQYISSIDIIGVVGYPNGDVTVSAKLAEVADLCGFASIIDVVLNPICIKSHMWDFVRGEIIEIFLSTNAEVRWIIETPTLELDEIARVSTLILETGGGIKTASGTKGATNVEHVKFIKKLIQESGKNVLLKASAGIKTPEDAQVMFDAGADIIGCSSPLSLL